MKIIQRWVTCYVLSLAASLGIFNSSGVAQLPDPQHGEAVPRDVREMYDRGLQFLAKSQDEKGTWTNTSHPGAAVTGLGVLAFLASGEDPNFGLYSLQIRRGVRALILLQDPVTGICGDSMYNHGFAMLTLAEAYGAVDERNLWSDEPEGRRRSIGAALELAVRGALTSQQKNPNHAWRYSPDARDSDTSVSGAVLVGLLAARNAGIEVPDANINQAIAYYVSMTSKGGQVAYAGGIGGGGFDESIARISIATLVYSIARRKDLPQYEATIKYLSQRIDQQNSNWEEYARYYQAQALFQGDVDAWKKWNTLLVRQLKTAQAEDGSFRGSLGPALSTSMSLLALALNYRFLPIYER